MERKLPKGKRQLGGKRQVKEKRQVGGNISQRGQNQIKDCRVTKTKEENIKILGCKSFYFSGDEQTNKKDVERRLSELLLCKFYI